jgi:type IV pilus assembly protein PilN
VILINLLPHREEKRKRRKAAFFAGIGAAALGGLAISAGWYAIVQSLISEQQGRNAFLVAEIKKLDEQIKDIATLKAEIESLKARQKAVEDLQLDRNLPVHLLNDLVKHTPEGVYYTTVKQDNNGLALNGIAQTQERVSELLRNTGNSSDWFTAPQLIETKSTSAGQGRDARRAYDFAVRVSVKRPQAAASAPTPAAAPAAAQKKV